MSNISDPLIVLDPTVSPKTINTKLANRPETLNGIKVGLLANGKHNSEELLQYVYDALNNIYEIGALRKDNKGNASRICPPELLNEIAEECDVVITASGD
jgi:hypothetical protein